MTETRWRTDEFITTWEGFDAGVRRRGLPLLARLDDFSDSVLVTGCQRSGTTMLSRIISSSDGMARYWFGPDDELDAALILSGYVAHQSPERHCFQTTYINDVLEYRGRVSGHRVVWVLREPSAVVRSMLYNWRQSALDRLFTHCGEASLRGVDAALCRRVRYPGSLRRACLAYAGKISRLIDLYEYLGPRRMMVVDYDDLVRTHSAGLSAVYDFIGLAYDPRYADSIRPRSTPAVGRRLSRGQLRTVAELCKPVYLKARGYVGAVQSSQLSTGQQPVSSSVSAG